MSRLSRYTQLIFGSSAGADQIAQFGSLAASAPAYTTSPSVIQALSNYLTGWFGAVIGGNSPCIEDMNALHYLQTYQLAYLMQLGTAEWDQYTTYYIGSIVQDGTGIQWVSLSNGNIGNVLVSGTNWKMMTTSGIYTPTFTAATGSSFSGSNFCWSVNGNIVSVAGQFNATPASSGGNSVISANMSLPVAPVSSFVGTNKLSGTCFGYTGGNYQTSEVQSGSSSTASITNTFNGTSITGVPNSYTIQFMYQIQ